MAPPPGTPSRLASTVAARVLVPKSKPSAPSRGCPPPVYGSSSAAPSHNPGSAPAPYRPSAAVSQRQIAAPSASLARHDIFAARSAGAPSVYRPAAIISSAAPPAFRPATINIQQKPFSSSAPPVYRPAPAREVLQARMRATGPVAATTVKVASAPRPITPAMHNAAPIQRMKAEESSTTSSANLRGRAWASNMQSCSTTQAGVLIALEDKVLQLGRRLEELYGGAMFVLDGDGGEFFGKLMSLCGSEAYPRPSAGNKSSHFQSGMGFDISKGETQYGFNFPKGCLLFGIVPETYVRTESTTGKSSAAKMREFSGSSFFQTEGAGITGLVSLASHAVDYVKHVTRGLNTGMMGESIHTEKTAKALALAVTTDETPVPTGLRRRKPFSYQE